MNEDEEDYDELPPITVYSSSRDSSRFAMPCASELASERERERCCELALAQLRTEHALAQQHTEHATAQQRTDHVPTQSDSSGSEGEAALAAAVTALRVRGTAPSESAPRLAALLAAAPALDARGFLADYVRAAHRAGDARADALARRALRSIAAVLQNAACGGEREGDEAACAGLWLCTALAAREGRSLGPELARTAHLLLDNVATDAEAAALTAALLATLPAPRARLEVADAVRGGGARADALAAALVRATLDELLPADAAPAAAARRFRRLDARDRYVALQLAARVHAHAAPAEAARAAALLAALIAAPPAERDRRPDALKVLLAASKLQVLFQVEK